LEGGNTLDSGLIYDKKEEERSIPGGGVPNKRTDPMWLFKGQSLGNRGKTLGGAWAGEVGMFRKDSALVTPK